VLDQGIGHIYIPRPLPGVTAKSCGRLIGGAAPVRPDPGEGVTTGRCHLWEHATLFRLSVVEDALTPGEVSNSPTPVTSSGNIRPMTVTLLQVRSIENII
jgi:hypothetical protein